MRTDSDPFLHHPELRGKIIDSLSSGLRTFTTATLATVAQELGLPVWWYSDADREALRATALSDRPRGDLWIFAYGSLMWDPAIRFAEVRRARAPGHARRFILKDVFGARGTPDTPGLMAALDRGTGCDGLLFRIASADIDAETEILWRREQVGPAYKAPFIEAQLADRSVSALTFVADHDAEMIDAAMTRDEQVRYAATGHGFLGSSLEYLENIQAKFAALGIRDPEVDNLLRAAEAYRTATR